MVGWMDGRVDGLEGRTSLPKATFLIPVRFHENELSWQISSSPGQQTRGETSGLREIETNIILKPSSLTALN